MGVRAAHERAPRDAGQKQIVDVTPPALNEADVLAAPQRLADIAVRASAFAPAVIARAIHVQPKTGAPPPVSLRASSLRQK